MALLTGVTAWVSLVLARVPGGIAAVWVSNGIWAGWLLSRRTRLWPGYVAAGMASLLAGLPPSIERTRHLGAAERTVVKQSAVLTRKWDPLSNTLINDLRTDLGQPVTVGLARTVVATLDRVVEQAVDAIAVIAIILGCVDTALRGDRVRPTRRVLIAEALDVIARLAKRCCRR